MDQPGLRPGAIVRSLAGRDLGTYYVVVRTLDERFVAVANGRKRTMSRPKVKNRRHLEVIGWVDAPLAERLERGLKVTDEQIAKALETIAGRVNEGV
ncbi:MAG: hypothetical protein A6D92_01715 [Symbiobacterium thermophilum]|uniref:Uncharacterized protein n=1 Tax=Symbiobacterium thermophilum TaxID=2734 RepID=A0A1Y2TA20_SYMTR|nr:MAG: hypothetical protein A6D92_01715 [Symbiobacterium thermophilum]